MSALNDMPETRVCMISSYPPSKDAVAAYCSKLSEALLLASDKVRIQILSQDNCECRNGRFSVVKAWGSKSILYPYRIFRLAVRWKPRILHIQHEYQLFGRGIYTVNFVFLLSILRLLRIPVIITMHQVLPRKELTSNFFQGHNYNKYFSVMVKSYIVVYTKLVGLLSSRVIVHLEIARKILLTDYDFKEETIQVVPHGLYIYAEDTSRTKLQAKQALGVQSKKVLLTFGEIRRGKGLEYIVKAMPKISAMNPNSVVIIAGIVSPENRSYLEELVTLSRSLDLGDKVIWAGRYIADDQISTYFKAADIVLLPYTDEGIIAASGPLSTALAYSKPIVVSRLYRFADLQHGVNALLVQPADPDSLADAANTLLKDARLSHRLSEGTKLVAQGRSWMDVALTTLNLYESACNESHGELRVSVEERNTEGFWVSTLGRKPGAQTMNSLDLVRVIDSQVTNEKRNFLYKDEALLELFILAVKNKIPLFYLETVKNLCADCDRLQGYYMNLKEKEQALFHVLEQIVSVLSKYSVDYLVFKTLRPFPFIASDIDLLFFSHDQARKALEVFTQNGYELIGPKAGNLTLVDSRSGIKIDLYKEISVSNIVYLDKSKISECVTQATLNELSVPLPTPEADLLLFIGHSFYKEQLFTLADFYAIVLSLAKFTSEQRDTFVELVKAQHIEYACSLLLRLTQAIHSIVFQTRMSEIEEILGRVCVNSLTRAAADRALRRFRRNMSLPYKQSYDTIAIGLMDKFLRDESTRQSLPRQIKHLLSNPQFLEGFVTQLVTHIIRETY